MFPCESATRPCGPESAVFSGYSFTAPVLGSTRPSLLASWPVYQSAPSGATAGSCGREFGVGTSYSWNCTLTFPAANRKKAEKRRAKTMRTVARIFCSSLRAEICYTRPQVEAANAADRWRDHARAGRHDKG